MELANTPAGMAAVVLGIARGALDAFAALAATKTPFLRSRRLCDDPVTQDRFGRAEVQLRSARAFMYQALGEAWQTVLRTGAWVAADRALLRMACAHAAEMAVEVVETAWKLAGTSGIYRGSVLDRCLRDAQVGAQNVGVSPTHFGAAGQLLLGGQSD